MGVAERVLPDGLINQSVRREAGSRLRPDDPWQAWVPLSVVVTYFVYTRTRTRGLPPDKRGLDGDGIPFQPGPRTGVDRGVTR